MKSEKIEALIERLDRLRREMLELEAYHIRDVQAVDAGHSTGAKNLLHYVALCRYDLHETQLELAEMGLSSLGRCESWALANVEAVLAHQSKKRSMLRRLSVSETFLDWDRAHPAAGLEL